MRFWPVYPCAYREHCLWFDLIFSSPGLSLCIQGTCGYGKTCEKHSSVYPCAYREHYFDEVFWMSKFGLSLCIQGTFYYKQLDKSNTRFIPVHTGNIAPKNQNVTRTTVYPCAYREHKKQKNIGHSNTGLSLCIQGT